MIAIRLIDVSGPLDSELVNNLSRIERGQTCVISGQCINGVSAERKEFPLLLCLTLIFKIIGICEK